MSETKCCDTCGYMGLVKYDDFFDYTKGGNEVTICYFCMEMTATLEKKPKKNDIITYQMFCQGMYWLLNNIRKINEGEND